MDYTVCREPNKIKADCRSKQVVLKPTSNRLQQQIKEDLKVRTKELKFLLVIVAFGSLLSGVRAQDTSSSPFYRPSYWISTEYLIGWIEDGPNAVPLIASGSLADDLPSALGQPGTQILAGGDRIDYGMLEGLRVTFGRWFDPCQRYGLEASGFALSRSDLVKSFSSTPTDLTSLSVPILLPDATESSIFALVNSPGGSLPSETLTTRYDSSLWGGQGVFLVNGVQESAWILDGMTGFKSLNLSESLELTGVIERDVGNGVSVVQGQDRFKTRSQFSGGVLGLRSTSSGRRLVLSSTGIVGLGYNSNDVEVSGNRLQTDPGVAPSLTQGFVFSEPTNIGTVRRRFFSVVPEYRFSSSYWLKSNISLDVGYTAMYWNNVVRPGDQIDRVVNPTQRAGGALVGDARPTPFFILNDFWMHSVSFGASFRF